jgi:quinol monooxygenase YgiN
LRCGNIQGGIQIMSVLVILKFQGDVAKFRQALTDHGEAFAKMAAEAKASGGGIHHRFGVGDGYVVVVDEWETVEHFQKFFANPDLQALIAASGAAAQPPEITVAEAISSPDEY